MQNEGMADRQTILAMAGTIRSLRLILGVADRDEIEKAKQLYALVQPAISPTLLDTTARAAAAIYAASNSSVDIAGAVAEAVKLAQSVFTRADVGAQA